MKLRQSKRQGHTLRRALNKAHTQLTAERYELGLSRRAVDALSRRAELERGRARDTQATLADEIDRLRRHLSNVARMVGVDSIAAGNPPSKRMLSDPGDSFQQYRLQPLSAADLYAPGDTFGHDISLTMHMLRTKATQDHLRDMTHLRVYLRDECVGYAISNYALDEAPREVLIERLAQEMAAQLVSSLRQGAKEKHRRYRFD